MHLQSTVELLQNCLVGIIYQNPSILTNILMVASKVMTLKAVPNSPNLIPPSSKHLARRRLDYTSLSKRQIEAQEQLLTIGGRVYMTEATLGGNPFTLVIDSGSSDTWVAADFFSCLNPRTFAPVDPRTCGFNASYDPTRSPTWESIPDQVFTVNYTGGEFLRGDLGVEEFGIGGVSNGESPALVVNQTIGVVEEGYWSGDGVSSGLMGLAYPALVSGALSLKYKSVMFTLTAAIPDSPIFALALSRPTTSNPYGGGYLSVGGVPPVSYDPDYVTVPTVPITRDLYAWYSLLIDGYAIKPPVRAGSRRIKIASSNPNPRNASAVVILDSGSSLMYLPDAIADHIATSFAPPAQFNPQSNLWIVKCNADAPRVGVIINGRTFWISEVDLMNKAKGAVGGQGLGAGNGNCVLGVQRAGAGSLVLGDVFLKNVLAVFDLKGARIRIAGREVY